MVRRAAILSGVAKVGDAVGGEIARRAHRAVRTAHRRLPMIRHRRVTHPRRIRSSRAFDGIR
jgi:hypothetical protein